jgi:hydrogenase small subunit
MTTANRRWDDTLEEAPMEPGEEGGKGFGIPRSGKMSRREFLKVCTVAAASVGLPSWAVVRVAEAASAGTRPPVIWLLGQACTGCTETLLRASHPTVSELILELVSLDYHATLFAAAGSQAKAAMRAAMRQHAGKYVCVVEGAIPTRHGGVYCEISGRPSVDILREVASGAGAIIALGSCASWGGIPSAEPNPTGAVGVSEALKGKTVVSLPGCPPNPYTFLGTVLQYATFGTLPALDRLGRPAFAYARTIHEDCPRRSHFDAGRFAERFGDEGHRKGYCLYKTGCKGPRTHANCSLRQFADIPGVWPVGIGHPCVGCTEQSLAFRVPLSTTVEIERPTPPEASPPIHAERGGVSTAAVGVAGLTVGALLGAGAVAARKLGQSKAEGEKSGEEK